LIRRELKDIKTGEIIKLYEGDRIIRKSQTEVIHKKKLNDEVKVFNESLGGFVFVLYRYCDTLFKNLKEEDVSRLFYIATFVNYEGFIIYEKKKVTKQILGNMLNFSPKNFNIFFDDMKRQNILLEENVNNKSYIKMNMNYFHKGKIVKEISNNNYGRIYIETIRYLYNNIQPRKRKYLGYLYKIIPYIHREKNILCFNTDAKDGEGLNIIRAADLKEFLGLHRNTIRTFINELVEIRLQDNSNIIVFIKNSKDDNKLPIMINPKIFYGGNLKSVDGKNILELFKLEE